MRLSVLAALVGAAVSTAFVIGACSSDPSAAGGDPDAAATEGGPSVDGSDLDSALGDGGQVAAKKDAAKKDGDTETDGAIPDDGGVIIGGDPPSVQLIGRFENDGVGDKFAFPGSKVVMRFKGSDAVMKLTQTDGFSVGHSWFNVVVDGVLQPKIEVAVGTADYAVATNLDPLLAHTVEIDKRTEGHLGVVRLESVTFPNGGMLLGPPVRPARRIEFLSDSTIDGFGIEGTRLNPAAGNYCGNPSLPSTNYGALAQFNNARKSMSALTAASLNAEHFLIAVSGKGLTKNEYAPDMLYFPELYDRTLQDSPASVYGFAWKPDAVVISLGGTDFGGLSPEPPGFSAAYGALVDKIRGHYPSAWIFLTVWSQIKDDNPPNFPRTGMKNAFQGIIAARNADTKLSYFQFPEANGPVDEVACQYHGTEAHHVNMAAALTTELKNKLGW